MTFHIRAEQRGGQFFDANVGGKTISDAKDRFQRENATLGPFHWRGAVVFCDGTEPAEEIVPRRRRQRAA